MTDLEFILNFEENKTKGIWLSGIEGEGEYVRYYENGNLKEHSHWKNNKLYGEYKFYHEIGQLWEHSFWKNGKRHGEYKDYHENGQLWEHSLWKNGKKLEIY